MDGRHGYVVQSLYELSEIGLKFPLTDEVISQHPFGHHLQTVLERFSVDVHVLQQRGIALDVPALH